MKKILLSLVVILAISNFAIGQSFYDGFTGTGNIGGDCTDATCNSNGWYTHSGSAAATIDIVAGSLDYTGLQASTGNKVYLTGNTLTLNRDVNAALTGFTNVAYYSLLLNVVDTTNLAETGYEKNYFMHFAAASGNSAGTTFFARLMAKATGASTYRLAITTNSASDITELATDLNCGTVYLVVVKYDIAASTATLWVNPTTLGGAEPAGSVTNSAAATVTAIASICIRNGYSTVVSGGTPKAYIDEIRVGETFASVTPAVISINEVNNSSLVIYPNPVQDYINFSINTEIENVKIYNAAGKEVINTNTNNIDVTSLRSGMYFINVTDVDGKTYSTKFVK